MNKGSFWLGIVAGLLFAGLFFVASPYLGIFDMTATGKPNILDWWGSTNLHTIVDRQGPELSIPADASVAGGIEHYASTCLLCHGAPDAPRRPWAESMLPHPPRLWEQEAQHMSDGGIFYVVDSGIRMTGMPAFGPDHSEDEIWNLVATVRQLENLNAEQRQKLTRAAQSDDHKHGSKEDTHGTAAMNHHTDESGHSDSAAGNDDAAHGHEDSDRHGKTENHTHQ